ncbi:MAG: ComEC/Rec2 family competence protein [Corynebacterium sp.]|uniref:ComEC/Rec2 family competence protein n=1 Tax=Corynebacterium sp. TaxID=1720 RepID=UPI0029147CF9|nr:ComEC/Rec2 family competence protein [Corynebacterium sp.]MDU4730120.1 ComEC/Rec2 family competence protein [Corynebacterium sp.]
MRELRLVPGAATAWLAVIAVLLGGRGWAIFIIAAVVGCCLIARQWGQALFSGMVATAAALVAAVRQARAAAFDLGTEVTGRLTTAPTQTSTGGWLLRLKVPGYPTQLPVFSSEPVPAAAGAELTARVEVRESDRAGVGKLSATATDVQVTGEPEGLAGWAAHVSDTFRALVVDTVGPSSQGLIPGMVLGDTSLQSSSERDLYIITGLSHLSAVSGANVAIVCSAAAMVCAAFALRPRARVAASLCALATYVVLVGFEPSVQRAAVAGLVGLLAVLNSTRMEPIHALSLGIIALLFVDSDLAVHFGFALSCAATLGIVALSPLIYKHLATTGWPAIFLRAVAVAIAADIVTLPLVALMSGEVSVLANILVEPATVPITIVGLIAAVFAQLGPLDVLGAGLLRLIEPFSWWINTIAHGVAHLPVVTIPASPLFTLLAYAWIIAGLLYHRPWLTLALTLAGIAWLGVAAG